MVECDEVLTFWMLKTNHSLNGSTFYCTRFKENVPIDTQTIGFSIPATFTRVCILKELIRVFHEMKQDKAFVIDLVESVVYIDRVPLQCPFNGRFAYPHKVMASITETLTSLCSEILSIIGSYVVVIADALIEGEDTFTIADFPDTITISVSPTSTTLFSGNSSLCPTRLTIGDNLTRRESKTAVVGDFIDEELINSFYEDWLSDNQRDQQLGLGANPYCQNANYEEGPVSEELAYIRKARFYRTPLVVVLTIGGITVEFRNAGTVGGLLDHALSLSEIYNHTISCFVKYLIGRNHLVFLNGRPPVQVRRFKMDGINPLSTASQNNSRVDAVSACVFNTAKLHVCGVMPRVALAKLVKPYDLKTMVRHLVGNGIVRRVVLGDKPQQAALKTINNHWLLLLEPTLVFQVVMKAMHLQLQASKSTEPFPLFDFNHKDFDIGKGIVDIPYMTRLMDLSFDDASRVAGDFEVVWGSFCDPTSSSSYVSRCLVTPRGQSCSEQSRLKIPDVGFIQGFPVEEKTFATAMDISRRLRLPLVLDVENLPLFMCGYKIIGDLSSGFCRPDSSTTRARFPVKDMIDATHPLWLWTHLVDYFHTHVNSVFEHAFSGLRNAFPATNLRVVIPQVFSVLEIHRELTSMMNCCFYVRLDPNYVASLFKELKCIRHSNVDDAPRLDIEQICGPMMEDSALKRLVTLLPSCMNGTLMTHPW